MIPCKQNVLLYHEASSIIQTASIDSNYGSTVSYVCGSPTYFKVSRCHCRSKLRWFLFRNYHKNVMLFSGDQEIAIENKFCRKNLKNPIYTGYDFAIKQLYHGAINLKNCVLIVFSFHD